MPVKSLIQVCTCTVLSSYSNHTHVYFVNRLLLKLSSIGHQPYSTYQMFQAIKLLMSVFGQ